MGLIGAVGLLVGGVSSYMSSQQANKSAREEADMWRDYFFEVSTIFGMPGSPNVVDVLESARELVEFKVNHYE